MNQYINISGTRIIYNTLSMVWAADVDKNSTLFIGNYIYIWQYGNIAIWQYSHIAK